MMNDREPASTTRNTIAVIIPSLNSPIIDSVVSAVLLQKDVSDTFEIIVVGKDAARLIPEDTRVRFVDTGQPVPASQARNRGLEATEASLLVFLDSDCLPQPTWLCEHVAAHKMGHRVVSGSVIPDGHNFWHLTYNLTLFHEILSTNRPGPRDFLATLNLSVDRSVIEAVGPMNSDINRVEDIDWTTRMRRHGITPYFWPYAAIYHNHNRTNLVRVWKDCALSGYHMRRLRLEHDDLLQAPVLLRYRRLVLLLSPMIAAWATGRILWRRPTILRRFWKTAPALYLTKIAWCWGASRSSEPA